MQQYTRHTLTASTQHYAKNIKKIKKSIDKMTEQCYTIITKGKDKRKKEVRTMFNKIRNIKYMAIIAELVQRYAETESTLQRTFICMEANKVKAECARLVMDGKMDDDTYAKLFKSGTNDNRHFLEKWLEQATK